MIQGYQTKLHRPNGEAIWVEDNGRIVHDEKGNIAYYEGSLQDITDRIRAERAIIESESKNRNLLNNIPQKVFYKNTELVYIAVNSNFSKDLNLLPEDLIGKSDFDIFLKQLAEKYRSDDRQIINSGVSYEFEEDYVVSGSTKTVHTVKAPVKDEEGSIVGVLGIFWDISERKQMEIALRISEQRYQLLFERSPISLWEEDFSRVKGTIDRMKQEGVKDFREFFTQHPELVAEYMSKVKVLDVNQTTLSLFQAKSKDELIVGINNDLTESAHTIFREGLIAIADGKTYFESEGQNSTLTGGIIDIHLRWTVAPGFEDSYSKVFLSITDISMRKQAERELKKQTSKANALVNISKDLSAAELDTQAIFDIIVQHSTNLLGDAGILTLVCSDNRSTKVEALFHREADNIPVMQEIFSSSPKPIGMGTLGKVIKSGEPILIPVISTDEINEMLDSAHLAYISRNTIHSMVFVPLIALGDVIGALEIFRHYEGDPFTGEDVSFLQSLANHGALTIMNARLHGLVHQQAIIDHLTGLFNRRHFMDLAEIEYLRSERYGHALSLIMFDLDHFKKVNNDYGHIVGDRVLQSLADRCKSSLRKADIIGRFGGEEFTILLPQTGLDEAVCLAERLRTLIEDTPLVSDPSPIKATVSVGVISKNENTQHSSDLIFRLMKPCIQPNGPGVIK